MVGRRDVDLGGHRRGGGCPVGRGDWQDVQEIIVMARDPICGMPVDEATALHAERDGEKFLSNAQLAPAAPAGFQMGGPGVAPVKSGVAPGFIAGHPLPVDSTNQSQFTSRINHTVNTP